MEHQRGAGNVARMKLVAREGSWSMFEQSQNQLAAFFFLWRWGEAGCQADRFVARRHPRLELNRREHFRGSFIEGAANRQQAFDAGQVRAPLDRADLRNAELGG